MRVFVSCVFLACVALSCNGTRSRSALDVRAVVLDPEWTDSKRYEILSATFDLRCEDVLWLIEKLSDDNAVRRIKAAWILRRSPCAAAASALWLACEVEEDDMPYEWMVASLGASGAVGKPYLLRLLHNRGTSPTLLAALAQSSGVQPRPSSWRGNEGFVTVQQGFEWWEAVGQKELATMVPEEPLRPCPKVDRR